MMPEDRSTESRPTRADEDVALADIGRRAETLWERLERTAEEPDAAPPAGDLERLLAPWSRVYAGGVQQALLRRLAWDGLDARQAAAALASPAVGDGVAWTATLDRYVELARAHAAGEPGARRAEGAAETPFVELWLPWIELAAGELERAAGPALDELTATARADLEAQLLSEIAWLSEGAAYELFAARRQRSEAGRSGVYRSFISACLADPIDTLYRGYPVLARQTCRRLRQWIERVGELARRLARDRREIGVAFGAGADPGPVTAVEGGVSDRHREGRQVLLLTFESGLRLAYKPRSLAPEAALGRFLAWCASNGLEPVPRAAAVLERAGYGWMERVEQEPLPSAEAARAYFRCAGVLVALAYALRAHDLNAENIVATRQGPVIVDAELLLQPRRAMSSSGEEGDVAPPDAHTCLATGLLTQLLPDGGEDRELGGLRGWRRRRRQRRVWHDLNGDGMTVEVGEEWVGPHHNAVLVGDALVDPAPYAEDLIEGFETAYRFLMAQRPALLADGGPLEAFRGVPVRVLFRDSQEYGRVVQLMQVPRNQRSGLAGSWLQEAMLAAFADADEPPLLWPLVGEERRALDVGDVPWFALDAEQDAVRTHRGVPVLGLFATSGLEAVRQRLRTLSEAGLEHELALVWQALAAPPPPGPASAGLRTAAGAQPGRLADPCRRLAEALGEELLQGIEAAGSPATSWDLAEGRLGSALFLAALSTGGGRHWQEATQRLLAPVGGDLDGSWAAAQRLPLGGLNGLGSVLWSLVWLSRLLERPELLEVALRVAAWITADRIAADRQLDLTRGAAGAILGLLAVAEATGEAAPLAAARRCGEHLRSHQQVAFPEEHAAAAGWRNPAGLVQTGWAHGSAGIARALAALGVADSDPRCLSAAAAAVGYERELYCAERRNWPTWLLDPLGRQTRQWMVACCRGAPGIALSRMLLPASMQDERLATELERALDTTAAAPLSRLDHLCCGALGRSSVLLTAAERYASRERREQAEHLALRSIERASERGRFRLHWSCYENRRHRPGLLKGIAGIGYQLLRLAGGGGLPDVLALELPGEHAGRCGGQEPWTT